MNTETKQCDCVEVCGWTKPHTLTKQGKWYVCGNCGTETQTPNETETFISFECEAHGSQNWIR